MTTPARGTPVERACILGNPPCLQASDDGSVPMLCEILAGVVDLARNRGEGLRRRRNLVGYVAKQTWGVSTRKWLLNSGKDGEAVKRRVREVFPYADHFVGVYDEKYDL